MEQESVSDSGKSVVVAGSNNEADLQTMRELDMDSLQDHLMMYVQRLYKHYMMKPVSDRPSSLQLVSQVECYPRRLLESIAAAEFSEFKQEPISESDNFICICYQWNDKVESPDNQKFELLPELLQFEDKICCFNQQVEKPIDIAKLPPPLVPFGQWSVTPYSEYEITTDSCDHSDYMQLKELNFSLNSHLRNYTGRLYNYFMQKTKEDRPKSIQNLSSVSICETREFLSLWFSETQCTTTLDEKNNETVLLYEFITKDNTDAKNETFEWIAELIPFKHRIKCIRGSLFPKDNGKQLTRVEVLRAFPEFALEMIEPSVAVNL